MGRYDGYRPTTKKYDPDDPHFNPFHPPQDTPPEVLKAFWGEEEDEEEDEIEDRPQA